MKQYILSLGLILCLGACNRYLDADPDSAHNIQIDSEDKIAELLTDAYPNASYFPFLELRTDNVGKRIGGTQNQLSTSMYYWEDYDHEDLDTPLNYWRACYRGIAQANQALELLASRPKTARTKALYGEAFMLRAYLHFMLVNIWSEPYRGSTSSSPGIPYVTRPEKEALKAYQRGTVSEVYEAIEQDLKRGISLVDDRYYSKPKFRWNKRAAYAFASRFYLHKGQWEQVLAYSDYVLGADPRLVVRKWNLYPASLGTNRLRLYKQYSTPTENCNLLLATTESRWRMTLPSDLYGTNDELRSRLFDKPGIDGGIDSETSLNLSNSYLFTTSPSPVADGAYISKFDELAPFGYIGNSPRDIYTTNVLLTTDEVLLNRMEAYAMLGRYDDAIDDLLLYMKSKFGRRLSSPREVYTLTSSENYKRYNPFYGLTLKQLALIKIIVELRQKEFLHEGLRWFDIRRFYIPIIRRDKDSRYRPLGGEDPRKTLQLPTEAIRRGLEPNFRDRTDNKPQF